MKYLVIGDAGFLGAAFCDHLQKMGASVLGIDTRPSKNASWERVDLGIERTDAMCALIRRLKPNVIVNFAGSFQQGDREKIMKVNCFSVIDLIEKCVASGLAKRTKFVLLGSAAEYGLTSGRSKLKETSPLLPVSDYGVSKACQTFMAQKLARQNKAKIVIVRPFNIIGPGMSPALFLGSCAAQVAAIESGRGKPIISVGNLENYRDILPLSIAIPMIYRIAGSGKPGEVYNVCSGRAVKMGDLLKKLLAFSKKKIITRMARGRLRPLDAPYVVGDNGKYLRLIGGRKISGVAAGINDAVRMTLDRQRGTI